MGADFSSKRLTAHEVAEWLKSAECNCNFGEDILSAIEGC